MQGRGRRKSKRGAFLKVGRKARGGDGGDGGYSCFYAFSFRPVPFLTLYPCSCAGEG